jgi:4-hydroxy-tetrahydrodipicolinate synthase
MRFEGILTALITPFRDGAVDVPALRALVESQVAAGVHGLVACGTTGETPALTRDEYALVVRTVVEVAAGRVPVLAGTGGNSTPHTIETTRLAAGLGADAALVVTPYYNKPQQEGMVRHFQSVAAGGGLPVCLYNVPGRTGVNLLPETVVRLAGTAGVFGIKEASGTVSQVRDIVAGAGEAFAVISGDDGLALAHWAVGSCGVISVASNVAPRAMVALWDAWKAGRTAEAARIDRTLAPLYAALFVESSPAPAKAAAAMLGMCTDEVREPLVPACARTREALAVALKTAGVL